MKRPDAAGFTATAREGETPRETTDAASMAEGLPGVHVRRLGAEDGFATLSIRGSGSNEVAVLVAGVPLTGGSDPTVDLGSLPVWPGAQMRVYRTFAPASLGPGSLGGTLVLDPPAMNMTARTDAMLAAGSLGAMRMRVSDSRPLGGDSSAGNVMAALSASRSDDEFDVFVPDGRGSGSYARRHNGGHAAANALVSWVQPVSFAAGRSGSSRVTLIAQARRQELPGTTLDPTPFDQLDSTRLFPILELTGETGGGAWRVRGYGRREEQSVRSPSGLFAQPHDRDAFIAAGFATGWRGRIADSARIDVQLDGGAERYAPGRYVTTPPSGARRLTTGAGADLDLPLARAVSLGASTRVDAFHDDNTTTGDSTRGAVLPTGHLGIEARAGELSAAAHGGNTARPPAFVELFGDRGAFLANPDLRTESAWTVDGGVRWASRLGSAAPRLRLDLGATGFATFAEDLITFVPVGAFGRARAENIGRARILGIEGEATLRWAGAELRAVYTGLDPRNQGDGACGLTVGTCERPRLPGRPAHDLVADLSYRIGAVRARYGVDWLSGIAADLQGAVEVPARALQSAGVYVMVPGVRGLRVSGEVKNLGDLRVVAYQGVSGRVLLPIGDVWAYPLPGRTFMVTARWSIETIDTPSSR